MPEENPEDAVQGQGTQSSLISLCCEENVENSGKPRKLEFAGQRTQKKRNTKRGAPRSGRRLPQSLQ